MTFEEWLIQFAGRERADEILASASETRYFRHFYEQLNVRPIEGEGEVSPESEAYLQRLQDRLEWEISQGILTAPEASAIVEQQYSEIYPVEGTGKSPNRTSEWSRTQSWATQQGKDYIKASQQQAQQQVAFNRYREDYRKYQGRFKAGETPADYEKRIRASDDPQDKRELQAFQFSRAQAFRGISEGAKFQEIQTKARAGLLESQRGRARARTQDELEREIQATAAGRKEAAFANAPPLEDPSDVFTPFLEALSPQQQRFFTPKMGQIFRDFEKKYGVGARQKWWERMNAPEEDVDDEPSTFASEFSAKYGGSPEAAQQTGARFFEGKDRGEFANLTPDQRSSLAWIGIAGAQQPRVEAPEQDPFKGFLSQYPFLSEFASKPARERGFRKSRFAPPTRWLGF